MLTPLANERLLTAAEAAARLAISIKTLRRHVASGHLRCVNIGTERRVHLRFAISQLTDFMRNRQPLEASTCPSINPRRARTTSTIFKSAAIAFTALPKPGTSEMRRQ
ncbi:helix-turn-helix domain-containing protein [Rhizobium leguminosarum]